MHGLTQGKGSILPQLCLVVPMVNPQGQQLSEDLHQTRASVMRNRTWHWVVANTVR